MAPRRTGVVRTNRRPSSASWRPPLEAGMPSSSTWPTSSSPTGLSSLVRNRSSSGIRMARIPAAPVTERAATATIATQTPAT